MMNLEPLAGFTNAFVAIDIGGTNTRVSVGSMRESYQVAKFLASSKTALLSGLALVGKQLRESAPHLCIDGGTCVALAGPILENGKSCAVTNYEGEDKCIAQAEFFATGLCPKGKIVLLNDLEATCFGLIALEHPSSHLKLDNFFETLWAPDNQKPALHVEKKYAVLAVGTGLGSAAIMWNNAFKNFSVVPLESGHSFVYPYGASHAGHKVRVFLILLRFIYCLFIYYFFRDFLLF